MPDQKPIEVEEWRPVAGWEDVYSVSSLGRVRRDKPGKGTKPGRIRRPRADACGYLEALFCDGEKKRWLKIAHLVTDAFIGPCPTGMERNHKNGDRADNRACNLEIVTKSENVLHAYRVLRGRWRPEGEANGMAKMTTEVVERLRREFALVPRRQRVGGRMDFYRLRAKELGVSFSSVQNAATGRTW